MDFYYVDMSPFCRSVMLTAKAIGVNLNKKTLDLFTKKDHMTPEFLAINPQHCVPTLVDGDLKLWESRPICTYLVSKYAKDDSLYPKDPKKRVLIDKLLYFDMGTLWSRIGEYMRPVVFGNEKPNPEKLVRLEEACGWFNGFIAGQKFCVGNTITVADHVLIATFSSLIESEMVDVTKYSNIPPWAKRCKEQMVGYESENGKGSKQFGEFVKAKFAVHK
jgi:glutathione S-transferase